MDVESFLNRFVFFLILKERPVPIAIGAPFKIIEKNKREKKLETNSWNSFKKNKIITKIKTEWQIISIRFHTD
jgi:hypothetical protein